MVMRVPRQTDGRANALLETVLRTLGPGLRSHRRGNVPYRRLAGPGASTLARSASLDRKVDLSSIA